MEQVESFGRLLQNLLSTFLLRAPNLLSLLFLCLFGTQGSDLLTQGREFLDQLGRRCVFV